MLLSIIAIKCQSSNNSLRCNNCKHNSIILWRHIWWKDYTVMHPGLFCVLLYQHSIRHASNIWICSQSTLGKIVPSNCGNTTIQLHIWSETFSAVNHQTFSSIHFNMPAQNLIHNTCWMCMWSDQFWCLSSRHSLLASSYNSVMCTGN